MGHGTACLGGMLTLLSGVQVPVGKCRGYGSTLVRAAVHLKTRCLLGFQDHLAGIRVVQSPDCTPLVTMELEWKRQVLGSHAWSPCVTFRPPWVSLRGPGQLPVLPSGHRCLLGRGAGACCCVCVCMGPSTLSVTAVAGAAGGCPFLTGPGQSPTLHCMGGGVSSLVGPCRDVGF